MAGWLSLGFVNINHALAEQGLKGVYWNHNSPYNTVFPTRTPDLYRTDSRIAFNWGQGAPSTALGSDNFVVRWSGSVLIPETGDYTFVTRTDDGVRLWVNGQQLINDWGRFAAKINKGAPQRLVGGQHYEIHMEYFEQTGQASAELGWQKPGDTSWSIIPSSQLNTGLPPIEATVVHHYDFDDEWSSITPVNDLIGSSDGSVVGDITRELTTDSALKGQTCYAANIDGGQITFNNLGLDRSYGAKTSISLWMKWNGHDGDMLLGWDAHDLWLYDGAFGFNTWSWDIYGIRSSGLAGSWHHVAAVFTNGAIVPNSLYIDGVLQSLSQQNIDRPWYVSGQPNLTNAYIEQTLQISGATSDTDGKYRFHGLVDNIKVYQGEISQAQVSADMNAENSCGGPRLEWHLDEDSLTGSGSTIVDHSGNGNNGSVIDTTQGTVSSGHVLSNELGKVCKAGTIVSDNGRSNYYALDTGLTMSNLGTISFWYLPNRQSGIQQTLFDGTSDGTSDKYFFLRRNRAGGLTFAFEDSKDNDFRYESNQSTFSPDVWVHISASWDLSRDLIRLHVNGQPQKLNRVKGSNRINKNNGTMGQLDSLYFGDNRNTYTVDRKELATADGSFDEVVIFDRALATTEINDIYQQQLMGNNWDGSERPNCGVSVNHYRLNLNDNQGLTCEAEPIELVACANVDCSDKYTDPVSLTMAPTNGWSQANPISFTTNTNGLTFRNPSPTTTNYTLTSANPTALLKCYIGASEVPCQTTFETAEFKFLYQNSNNIANQVAGVAFPQALQIQALKDNNGVCEGIFSGNVTVKLAQQSSAPSELTTLDFTVGGQAIGKNKGGEAATHYSNVSLNFGTDSKATLQTPLYQDAGQVQLHAKYDVAGISLSGSSRPFWVQPFQLYPNLNLAATHKAGVDFGLQVTAVNYQNQVTPNYQPGQIMLQVERLTPKTSGSVDGDFFYTTSTSIKSAIGAIFHPVNLTPFDGGISITSQARYSEVGELAINVKDSDYGDQGLAVVGSGINTGRFTPDHFEVEVSKEGILTGQCDAFAYTGEMVNSKGAITYDVLERPTLKITPVNYQGALTQNYIGTFNKLNVDDITVNAPTADTVQLGKDLAAFMTLSSDVSDVGEFTQGTDILPFSYQLSAQHHFTYDRNLNSKIDPFISDINIVIDPITDSDNVTSVAVPTIEPTGIEIRYGRASLTSSYGSETSDLMVPLNVQYYNAGRFINNEKDNCFDYKASKLTYDPLGSLAGYTDLKRTLFGVGALRLAAPGEGNIGTRIVTYPVPSWLRFDWDGKASTIDTDPKAPVLFGRYRGNDRVISWREVK